MIDSTKLGRTRLNWLIFTWAMMVLLNSFSVSAQDKKEDDSPWTIHQGAMGDRFHIFEGQLYLNPEVSARPYPELYDKVKVQHLLDRKAPPHEITVLSQWPVYRDRSGRPWLQARDGELLVGASKDPEQVVYALTRGPWRFSSMDFGSKGLWNGVAIGETEDHLWVTDERGIHTYHQGKWHYDPVIKAFGKRTRRVLSAWDVASEHYYVMDPGDQWVEQVEVEEFIPDEEAVPGEELEADDLGFSTQDKVMYISPRLLLFTAKGKREISLPEQWTGDDDPAAFAPLVQASSHREKLYLLRRDGLIISLQQDRKIDPAEVALLVKELASQDYETRRQASIRLVALGDPGLNAIDDELSKATDPEVIWRLSAARHQIRSQKSLPVSLGKMQIDRAMAMATDASGSFYLFGVYANSELYDVVRVDPEGEVKTYQGLGIAPSAWRRPFAISKGQVWLSGQVDQAGQPIQSEQGKAMRIDLLTGELSHAGPDLERTVVLGFLKGGRVVLISDQNSIAIQKP